MGIELSQGSWGFISASTADVTGGTYTSYRGSSVLTLSASVTNGMTFQFIMPTDYAEGTNVYPYMHLICPDANAGNIILYWYSSWANINEVFPAYTVNYQGMASSGTADEHFTRSPDQYINGSGKKINSVMLCNAGRNGGHAADTYGSVVYLVGAGMRYLRDTTGSRFKDKK